MTEDLEFVFPKKSGIDRWEERLRRIFLIGILAAVFFMVSAPVVVPQEKWFAFESGLASARIHSIEFVSSFRLPQVLTPSESCGNRTCDSGETTQTCFLDCVMCDGDKKCERTIGENPLSCPTDCPSAYS
ncbi:MAG: hypothetical protein Q7R47_00205 [Candidatus Diapherotrites archaeon]|nr:hypothetical protein [Candidatus Diapherotrites archaeon]